MIQLDLYHKEILNFLRTCTVKNTFFVQQFEKQKLLLENRTELEVWENPYYLNMNGLYSPNDEPMYVNSLDTGNQILYDKAILDSHPKTRAAYRIPNKRFFDLLEQYPTQIDLIKSILYPAEVEADSIIKQDIIIPITSIDDATTINLTRADLALHPETLALYRTKGIEYQTIITNYAEAVDFINAVLFPIRETDYIVTCNNMTLVAFDSDLLHSN